MVTIHLLSLDDYMEAANKVAWYTCPQPSGFRVYTSGKSLMPKLHVHTYVYVCESLIEHAYYNFWCVFNF